LPSTFDEDVHPAVVWNGSTYVVVSAAPRFGFGLVATEVREDGSRGASRVVIEGIQDQPAIAWNGAAYLFAWVEQRDAQRVQAMLVDGGLHPLTEPVTLGSGDGVSVATNGSGFLVAWHDYREQQALYATFTATGSIARAPASLGSPSVPPSAASNGGDYAILWGTQPLRVTKLSAAGERLGEVALPDPPPSALDPRIHWNGSRFVVVWTSMPGTILGAEVDSSLNVLRTIPALAVRTIAPVLATNGERTLLVAETSENGQRDVIGTFDRDVFLVATGATSQLPQDAVVSPRGTIGTVWIENRIRLMFGRSTGGGEPLDGAGIAVVDEAPLRASIAATADAFAIVYSTGFASFAVRFAHDGRRIDAEPIALGRSRQFASAIAAIASDGHNFTILYANDVERVQSIYALTLPPAGAPGTPRQISTPPADSIDAPLAIAWNGAEYVAAFGTQRLVLCGSRLCSFTLQASLVRMTPALQIVSTTPAGLLQFGETVELAADASRIVLARSGFLAGTLQRFTATGQAIDATPVPLAEGTFFAEVVRAGTRDLLATAESREDGSTPIFIRDIDAMGAEPLLIATRGVVGRFAVAPSPRGGVVLVYPQEIARSPEAHPEGVPRAVIRFLGMPRARVTSR
ncbi:MAG TPA: hypothetical protein VF698_02960, partial [Thermoanaerobaculia bacterium]